MEAIDHLDALFLHDPDGLKLEILHRPSERDLARRVDQLAARVAELESRLEPTPLER
jgi:glyoxylase I family protein